MENVHGIDWVAAEYVYEVTSLRRKIIWGYFIAFLGQELVTLNDLKFFKCCDLCPFSCPSITRVLNFSFF